VSLPFHITLTHKQTGATETVAGTFSEEEAPVLQQYDLQFKRLASCRLRESQADLELGFTVEVGKPAKHKAKLPPEEDVSSFLHRMRPFILEREPASFFRVRNLLARHLNAHSARAHLEAVKARYVGEAMGFRFTVRGLLLNGEQAVDMWLNAFEYHQDKEKQAELSALYAVFPETSACALFLCLLLERAAAIEKLASLVNGLIKKTETR
jgi:hypothetical protein